MIKEIKLNSSNNVIPKVNKKEPFKLVNSAPEPEKEAADTDVIEQVVPVKPPVH